MVSTFQLKERSYLIILKSKSELCKKLILNIKGQISLKGRKLKDGKYNKKKAGVVILISNKETSEEGLLPRIKGNITEYKEVNSL